MKNKNHYGRKNAMLLFVLLFCSMYSIAQVSNYTPHVYAIDEFKKQVAASGIIYSDGSLYIVSENCEKIYKVDTGSMTTIAKEFAITGMASKAELEGITRFHEVFYVINEDTASECVYKLKLKGGNYIVDKTFSLSGFVMGYKDTENGFEGIAANDSLNILYILREKYEEIGSYYATIYSCTIKGNNLIIENILNIPLPDSSWRYSDIYYNKNSGKLVCLNTKKEGEYHIVTLALDSKGHPILPPANVDTISEIINSNGGANMEGITMDSSGNIYMISDNYEGKVDKDKKKLCDKVGDETLLLKLVRVDSMPGISDEEFNKILKDIANSQGGAERRKVDIIPKIADDNNCDFCGYRVSYNPCTNCTSMFINNCDDITNDDYCNPNKICENYTKPKQKKDRFIDVGRPFQYRLYGIDLETHDVEISQEIINDNNPGDIAKLTFQLLSGIPYADLTSSIPTGNGMQQIFLDFKMKGNQDVFPSCKKAEEYQVELKKQQYNLDTILKRFRKTKKLHKGVDTLELMSKIEDINKKYEDKEKECSADKIRNEYETNKMKYDNEVEDINSAFRQLADYFALKNNNNCKDLDKYDKELKIVLDRIQSIFKCDSRYDPISCFNKLIKEKKIILEKTIKKIKNGKLEKYFDDFDVVVKSLKDNETIITDNKELISALFVKKDIYTQISIPQVDMFTDAIKIKLNVAPKEKKKGGTYANAEHIFYTKDGWDFSAGTGILVTGLKNPTYSFIQDTENGESGYRLIRNQLLSGSSNINLGISVQSFFMHRFPYHIYIGPTLGAGVTFGIDRSQLSGSILLGGAIMVGTYPKVAISGGFALSSIQKPDASYNMPDFPGAQSPVFFKGDKPSKIDYTLNFKPNWFVSLTVNFGKPPIKPTPLEPAAVKKKEDDTAGKAPKKETEKETKTQATKAESKEIIKVVEEKVNSFTIPTDFNYKKILIKK